MAEHREAAKPHRHAHRISRMAIGAVVVIAIVAIILYYSFSGGAATISTSTTVTLTGSPSYFSIGSGIYSLSVAHTGSGVAYVLVNKLPIFINPLLNVTLYEDNITKVNAGSGFADIGLTLESVNGASITVKISPLDPSLQIAPDSGRISIVNDLLFVNNGNSAATSSVTTTAITTVATTTIVQTNTTNANIMAALNKNRSYALIQNYSTLYTNTASCTQNAYNTAYILHYGYAPVGMFTYPNVSIYTPYSLYKNTANLGKGNYSVTYSTKTVDSLYNNTPAVVIKVNVSTSSVSNVIFENIFQGQDYTSLYIGYSKAVSIGGPCGIVVP